MVYLRKISLLTLFFPFFPCCLSIESFFPCFDYFLFSQINCFLFIHHCVFPWVFVIFILFSSILLESYFIPLEFYLSAHRYLSLGWWHWFNSTGHICHWLRRNCRSYSSKHCPEYSMVWKCCLMGKGTSKGRFVT